MRILIIVVSHTLQEKKYWHNLRALPSSLIANLISEDTVDIVACTTDPEPLPPCVTWACQTESLSYSGKQFNKVAHVLSFWLQHYDWYIKTRPEMLVRESIDLRTLTPATISARAREYIGPRRIKYGSAFGGNSIWKVHLGAFRVDPEERTIVLDDQIYFFDDEVRRSNAFIFAETSIHENEWFHTATWKSRGIKLEVIGIHCLLETHGSLSGDLVGV